VRPSMTDVDVEQHQVDVWFRRQHVQRFSAVVGV
jgi:hypothetical protein